MAPRNNKRKPTQSPARHRRVPTPPPPPPPPTPPPPPVTEEIATYTFEGLVKYFTSVSFDDANEFFKMLVRDFYEDNDPVLREALRQINCVLPTQAAPVYVPAASQTDPIMVPPPTVSVTTQTVPIAVPPPAVVSALSPPVPRTYAQVTTDTMDLDLPSPSPSTQVRSAAPPRPSKSKAPNPKPTKPKSRITARAFVVHGISVASPLSSTVRKVEMAVKQVAIGARWLLSVDRRKGKTASSVVVFFYNNVNVPDVITSGDRKHRVEEYEWGRVNRVNMDLSQVARGQVTDY